jgi:acetylornithine deacetylase/succinyl-diaminopimelate desuccinylase-like protein
VPLQRDVVLLAVGDEEVGNQGIRHLIEHHWQDIGCSHVLNEGGVGLPDLFFSGQTVYPISVGEKGVLWAKLIATGEPGHGSTPTPDESPERLHRAITRLERRAFQPTYHAAVVELLDAIGEERGCISGRVLQTPWLWRGMLKRRFATNPLLRATVTDTVHITGYGGALKPNVVPVSSWAHVDIRTLPGTEHNALLTDLQALIDDPNVSFEVLQERPAAVSPMDDAFYDAIKEAILAHRPDAVVGPALSVGFTDSIFLRELGVHVYGMVPFELDEEALCSFHGNNERIDVDNLVRGVQIVYDAVHAFASENP